MDTHLSFQERKLAHKREKQEIAEHAVTLVKEQDVIALHASTSTLLLALALRKHYKSLTIITNSIPIISELALKKNFKIVIPGGVLSNPELSIGGPFSEQFLSNFHADIAFISPGGVTVKEGITEYIHDELPIQKSMLKQSARRYVIADHQKINTVCMLKICHLNEVDGIITDSQVDDGVLSREVS